MKLYRMYFGKRYYAYLLILGACFFVCTGCRQESQKSSEPLTHPAQTTIKGENTGARHETFFLSSGIPGTKQAGKAGEDIVVIDLDPENSQIVDFNALFDTLEYIYLEETEESLVASPMRWEIMNESILLCDLSGKLFRFGLDGTYLNRVARLGRGPDEVLTTVWFSAIDDTTLACPSSHGYLFYRFDGKMISRIQECGFVRGNVKRLNNSYVHAHQRFIQLPDTHRLGIYSADFKTYTALLKHDLDYRTFTNPIDEYLLYRNNADVLYFDASYDTIYRVEEGSVKPLIVFNYVGEKYPRNKLRVGYTPKSRDSDFRLWAKSLKIRGISISKDILVVTYDENSEFYMLVYDFRTGVSLNIKGFRNGPDLLSIQKVKIWVNDGAVYWYPFRSSINRLDTDKVGTCRVDEVKQAILGHDNPTLIKTKLAY